MKNNKRDYLKGLTEKDIKIICNNADLNNLLIPMKKNNKKYSRDISKLGRLDKKSILVQKYLPNIAFDYCMKNNPEYQTIIYSTAKFFKKQFATRVEEFKTKYEKNIEPNEFTIKEYKEFIIYNLLEYGDKNIDLELFLLELKLNNIKISDDLKKELENQSLNIAGIVAVKKEAYKEYKLKIKSMESEFKEELRNKEVEYRKENKSIEKEIKNLKKEIENKNKKALNLKDQIEILNKFVTNKDKSIKSKDEKIKELLTENNLKEKQIKDISEQVNKSKEELYNIIKNEWEYENKENITNLDILNKQIQSAKEELNLLNEERIKLKEQISVWNTYVNEYIEKLDFKVLDYKISSILFDKLNDSSIQSNVTRKIIVDNDNLYIQEGYKSQKIIECIDYDDYLDIVENNLSCCGVSRKGEYIYECFNASINSNLIPLICGYQSRKIAIALITSRFGEMPTIISVPGGYNNTSNIDKIIEQSSTNTIIIEDVFGKMNEGFILPLLRKNQNKQIIFTAENIEDLEYLPKYYYNHIYLIGIDNYSIEESDTMSYAYSEKIFKKQLFDKKSNGNKIAKKVLSNINFTSPYILSRGKVLNYLLLENEDEKCVIDYLFNSELKWIVSEDYIDKLEELVIGESQMI